MKRAHGMNGSVMIYEDFQSLFYQWKFPSLKVTYHLYIRYTGTMWSLVKCMAEGPNHVLYRWSSFSLLHMLFEVPFVQPQWMCGLYVLFESKAAVMMTSHSVIVIVRLAVLRSLGATKPFMLLWLWAGDGVARMVRRAMWTDTQLVVVVGLNLVGSCSVCGPNVRYNSGSTDAYFWPLVDADLFVLFCLSGTALFIYKYSFQLKSAYRCTMLISYGILFYLRLIDCFVSNLWNRLVLWISPIRLLTVFRLFIYLLVFLEPLL